MHAIGQFCIEILCCPDNVLILLLQCLRTEITMSVNAESRSERVDLRMTPSAKQMLQHAAAASNKTLTEFLLDSGMHAAYDTLADRRAFVLDDGQWAAFMVALDAPPADNPRLRALLARKPAWEA
jgi:uncharacterized protein (DUF1778 family)